MFTKLSLHNFQSHKDTVLELDPGINCIVGTSDSGKTAILRGFRWCYENRPTGTDFVSHWCKKEDTSVRVETTDGDIVRVRTDKRNGYDVSGVELGAIGLEVPAQVRDGFNMSDVNISHQDDPPFLLSETAGDVAKYLNKIIHLDLIDTVLSNAESMKRGLKKDTTEVESTIKEDRQKINKFFWIEEAQPLFDSLVTWEVTRSQLVSQREALQGVLNQLSKYGDFITKTQTIINAFTSVKVDALLSKQEEVQEDIRALSTILSSLVKAKKLTDQREVITKINHTCERIDILLEDKKIVANSIRSLTDKLMETKKLLRDIVEGTEELQELKKGMPDVCPSCGRPMEVCNEA